MKEWKDKRIEKQQVLDTQEKVLYEEADIKNRDSKAYARFKAPAYGGLYDSKYNNRSSSCGTGSVD